MASDILQIIAAARDLVRRCDEGQAVWLQRLARPLPPMLRDDSKKALSELRALTEFDPFDCLGEWLPDSSVGDERNPARQRATHPRAKQATAVRHKSPGSVVPFNSGRHIAPEPVSIKPSPPDTPSHPQRPRSGKAGAYTKYERSPSASDTSSDDATTAKSKSKEAAEASGKNQGQKRSSVDSSESERADGKFEPQDAASPKPHSRAQTLAAQRKAYAKERHQLASERGDKDRRPNSDDLRANGSETPSSDRPPKTSKGNTHPGSALRATALAGSFRPTRRDDDGTPPTSRADGLGAQTRQADNGGPQTSHSGSAIQTDEFDPQLSTPPAPAEASANTRPSERDLAHQLADAAYLHGIDLT